MPFLVSTQHSGGRCTCQSPIMQWANVLNECSKNFTEAEHNLSQRQLVRWYRWVPRTLTLWGKPVLQGAYPPKDNSGFLGPPLYGVEMCVCVWYEWDVEFFCGAWGVCLVCGLSVWCEWCVCFCGHAVWMVLRVCEFLVDLADCFSHPPCLMTVVIFLYLSQPRFPHLKFGMSIISHFLASRIKWDDT